MSLLLFNIHYRTVLRNAKLSGLVPPDDSFSSSRFYYISYDILVSCFLIWKLTCATMAIFRNNFEDMMLSQCIAMLTLTGLLLSLIYAAWRPRFSELISTADQLSSQVLASRFRVKEAFSSRYTRDSRFLSSLNTLMYTMTCLCPFVYCISVPIGARLMGTPVTALPVPTNCLFELRLRQLYGVFVFLQFLGLATPAMQKLGNEFIMFSLYKIQSAYLQYLAEALEDIELSIETESDATTARKLVSWVKLHQDAVKNIQQLQKVHSPVIVLYYLSMIVIVAGGLFYQLNAEDANLLQECTVGLYMLITVVQFFLLCHLAEELATQAEKVSVAVYRISWYKLKGNAWFVGMVINMANKPVSMTAYSTPSFKVNREAFLTFMVNLVSAYMGFSKIKEM